MKKSGYILLVIIAALAGCIRNDIPYPHIHANITSISAVGETKAAIIDSTECMATLYLPEDADIYSVRIERYTLTPEAKIVSGSLDGAIDLSSPYRLTLSIYQDYQWTIIGVQNIDRYFSVEGQIGQSEINAENHTVKAYVTKKTPLESLKVLTCKIAPTSATVTPDIQGKTLDFSKPVELTVSNYGHTETWTITIEYTDTPVATLSADAWTCVAWVYGEGEAGRNNYVQYRIKGDTEWIDTPQQWITSDGGAFNARIEGLTPNTTYEARAASDAEYGEVLEFTTGSTVQMPNSDFDAWWLDGKVWCPWPEGGVQFWDTGNKGAATLGQSNSIPTDDTVDGKGKAAMLQTKFIGIGVLGKLGAGNIFVGRYVRTDGTNGVLSFGKEFSERPTKLKGYMKYKTSPISSVTAGFEDWKGRPDTCSIWIALIDTPEPFEIRTNPNNRQLFDPEGDYVIAYGSIQSGDDIDAYRPFEITLKYNSTSRRPTYIIVAASASKYGDYFTGGNGSVLYVDDFELEYDY